MNHQDPQPIINEPALLFKEHKLLVVADLHIGIERELRTNGVHIKSQTHTMEQRLLKILLTTKVKEIVFLGDIKHNIPSSTIQERTDVKRFLNTLQRYAQIHVVPGNHDGFLQRLVGSEIIFHSSEGCVLHDIGFIHGHRWPAEEVMRCAQVVVGHTHPTVQLTDRLGYRIFEPCWLRSSSFSHKLREKYPMSQTTHLLVLPAFNPLCGGIPVNREQLLGPFASIINLDEADVYLTDGSFLGKVKDLKESS